MAGAAALLAAGAATAQEPAKPKQVPTPQEVAAQVKEVSSWFISRDWHAGNRYATYGPFPGYGGYAAPFYMGYYPGYGMGYFGYDWSPARMRITEINLNTVQANGGKGAAGDSTARAMVMKVKEWTNGKTFTDEKGRRWKLCHGNALDGKPMAISGWMLTAQDGTQTFFTASGRLFCLEAAVEKK
jgi:hypothetical protein